MEGGSWNAECGRWKVEGGLRPLRAVGSGLYEPEAVRAYAYAPVGRGFCEGGTGRWGDLGERGTPERGRLGDGVTWRGGMG
jgi:hypothetical protein